MRPISRLGLALLIGFLFSGSARPGRAVEARRPNIVVILSDDMGYSDVGCYGGEIATPNLDALASKGVRFTQFYNNARCCPSRASLMTGLHPHQAGVGHMVEDRGRDGYRGTLNRQSVTIAEVLRPAGYRTYMTGKWHLSRFTNPEADRASWPLGRGFEKFYGTIDGAGSFYDPGTLCRQETIITVANDPEYHPQSYYYTDAITDHSVRYLRTHHAETPEKPFFLYIAYTAAHWPMQAPESAIAKYRGRFDAGYAPVREGRLRRMKESGLLPEDSSLSPVAEDWAKVGDKAWEARCKEVYAAMVDSMDVGIGRIVAQLEASGQLENTLILYMQDNGACAETVGRIAAGAPGELRPMTRDQPQPRKMPLVQTRDGRRVRTGPGVMPGPDDTYVAYGRGWANVSNTPFREYKHWTHEGGIATPLIAHWPGGIRPDRVGRFERQPSHLIDVMATCVDISGADYPTEVLGQQIKPREGVSLRPALNGEPLGRSQPIFWEHEGNRAVRDGDWKLVAKADAPWELYNIAVDRSEQVDLTKAHPDLARELAARWDAYAIRANVLPLGAWRPESAPLTLERRFNLDLGTHLDRPEAPPVANRSFTIHARFRATDNHADGVIVAQGASAVGYALFLKENRPHFLIRTGGASYSITGPRLTPGEHAVKAQIDAQGVLTLELNGRPAAHPVLGKLLAKMPTEGLEVGRDDHNPVGAYASPFAYPGVIESVTIEVGGN